ncbi:uncharacterized protein LOC111918198 [Lactuca sativa]|uniref:uncharacterized protein LOC111918198 n=1 Tax=Lactuca sativa TaxID=4236 RepID=UPI001C68A083|nr:uncharacterized protein LOC111918198 [Lactuca sativa]
MALIDIRVFLESMSKKLSDYDLPNVNAHIDLQSRSYREVQEEYSINMENEDLLARDSLNPDQKFAYDEIMRHVDENISGVFFIYGPGGTVKTFLYKALLANIRARGLIALATATSGVAANNMPGGRTTHSRFGIPLNLDNNSMCKITKQSGKAQLFREEKVIIWDEATMAKRQAVEAVYRTMQDITDEKAPFQWKDNGYGSVDEINNNLIERFSGEQKVYYSFDEAEDDKNNLYPIEYLNSLNVSGVPPHYLRLNTGCPVILLRNIDPSNGLCNGTRLICRAFQQNIIDAEISVGQHAGKRVFLPRIPLCPSDNEKFPFKLKRKQFPIQLSFSMTINKAQGQTIPNRNITCQYQGISKAGKKRLIMMESTHQTLCTKKFYVINKSLQMKQHDCRLV